MTIQNELDNEVVATTNFAKDEPEGAILNSEGTASPEESSEVRRALDETKREVARQGSRLAEKASETARQRADEAVGRVSQKVRNAERAAREALASMDDTQPEPVIKGARYVSEHIGNVADYLETHDSGEITNDLRKMIRENPGATLATLAVAGFFVGRFLKAGKTS